VESDIENTQNMTAVMLSLAPVAAVVGGWFQKLTGGFSTAGTAIAKWIAGSETARNVVQGLAVVFSTLAAVVSGVSAIALAVWLFGAGAAVAGLTASTGLLSRALIMLGVSAATSARALGILGVAMRALTIATGIGLILTVIATGIGIYMNFAQAAAEAAKALNQLADGAAKAVKAMQDQADAVKTLSDLHEALAHALSEAADAQNALNDAQAEGKGDAEIGVLRRKQEAMARIAKELAEKKARDLAPTAGAVDAADVEFQKKKALKEQEFQLAMQQASPERRAALMQNRIEELRKKGERAQAGVNARAAVQSQAGDAATASQAAAGEVTAAQAELDDLRKREQIEQARDTILDPKVGDKDFQHEDFTDRIAAARARRDVARQKATFAKGTEDLVGQHAPADSSAFADFMAKQTKDPVAAAVWKARSRQRQAEETPDFIAGTATEGAGLGKQKETEDPLVQLALQRAGIERDIAALRAKSAETGFSTAQAEYDARKRLLSLELAAAMARPGGVDQAEVARIAGASKENEGVEAARQRGLSETRVEEDRDLAMRKARREGKTAEAVKLGDLSDYSSHYKANRDSGFDQKEAGMRALAATNEDIAGSVKPVGAVVADSLQRIGGGGGSYGVSGDAVLSVAKRQATLLEEIKKVLLEQKGNKGGGVL